MTRSWLGSLTGSRVFSDGVAQAFSFGLLLVLGLLPGVFGAELDGANDTLLSTAPAQPNLRPQNVLLSSYGVLPGDVITVEWTMTNSGNGFCFASFTGIRLGTSPSVPPASSFLDLTFTTPEIPAKSAVRQTASVTIPTIAPLGTYYIWVLADVFDGGLNQSSKADDAAHSAGLAVQNVRGQPNLRPLNIELTVGTVRPGDPLTVMWTLTNSGSVACPASYSGLHLGTSRLTPPSGDSLNVLTPTPELAANSAVRLTNVVTIPPETAEGTYYLWVVADDVENSTLNQSSRADDSARSSAFTVTSVIARPNLIPGNVTLSSYAALPGDVLAVACTLTNAASGNCPPSITGLHFGTSATEPPTSDGLNLKLPTPAIEAGASVRITNVITIPPNTPLGTYYLWVLADDVENSSLNQTTRSDDATRSAPLTVALVVSRPNLAPQNILLSAYSVRPGDLLSVMWTTTNTGNGDCRASLTGLHLGTSGSEPPANDGLDIRLPTPEIPAHSAVRQTNTITIPAGTPTGNYYVWVVADDMAQSTLNQSSRADDAARSAILGVVTMAAQPNLIPQNVIMSSDFARPADQVTIRWTIRNLGNVMCPASLTGVRLGQTATAPPTNGLVHLLFETPEIGPEAAVQQTNIVTIPLNAPLGTNYFWVVADDVAASTLNQSSREDDVARSGPLTIVTELPRPNLVPLNVTLSVAAAPPGGQVTVAWTMTNSGNANCPASTTGLHLGSSASAPPASDSLNLKIATPGIDAHSSLSQSYAVTLPASTAPGIYFLWVVADNVVNGGLNQSSKTDDATHSGPLAVLSVTLSVPAAGETVIAPPLFRWVAPGFANVTVYLAKKLAPVFGTDKIVFFDSLTGTNSLQLAASNWVAAVNALGYAQNYYWTIGSENAAQRQIYAEWQPFKAMPLATGATIVPASGGDFRFELLVPNQAELVVETSDNLSEWIAFQTVTNSTGTVILRDDAASGRVKRFYRAKQ
jgi:hypothetical protein